MIYHNIFSAHPPVIKQHKTSNKYKANYTGTRKSGLICQLIQFVWKIHQHTRRSMLINPFQMLLIIVSYAWDNQVYKLCSLSSILKELIAETGLLLGCPVPEKSFSNRPNWVGSFHFFTQGQKQIQFQECCLSFRIIKYEEESRNFVF
jgi:hypothetical protein